MGRALRGFNLPGAAFLIGVLLLWHLIATAQNSVAAPGPMQVLLAGFENRDQLAAEIGHTLRRAGTAFAIGVVVFIPFGILCGRVRALGQIVDPIIGFFDTIPGIAMIPLVMLFFGTGDAAKIAIIVYATMPTLLIHTIEGVRNGPPMLNRVARSLRLSRLEIMVLIDLPAALPLIVTGLRLAIGGSLLVGITSELLLATDGIGTFLQRKQESFQIAAGLSGNVVISIVGLVINQLVRRVERRLLFWHYR